MVRTRTREGDRGPGGGPGAGGASDNQGYQEVVVKVNRCAKVMKGGRRFSFSTLVIVGNRDGRVGYGFGKARAVPGAMEKGVKDAKKRLVDLPRVGITIPHEVTAHFESSTVRLVPAAPGTGIVASAAMRAILDLGGVKDVLTKVYGSTNPLNVVKATFLGISGLRTKEEVETLRGVSLS